MKNGIPVRTLVIDDDESVCRKLYAWLEAEAYDVSTFTNPSDGLRHASMVACELALVDLRMPDADGTDVIAALCQASPHTRVVAMTAFPETDQVLSAIRAGARDLLEKPIQRPKLLQTLDRQLAERGIAVRTEHDFNCRLGARLREIRRADQKTQQQIAALAGISAAQLSQIELGKTATSTWTLARICGGLQTPLSALFREL